MDEIFSSSNLLIRLKPAGQSGAHEGHGPGTGGSPQSPSWGVRGSLRGSFLTRDILILVPSQVLVPELRAQLPCEAKQHIAVTAVSPGTVGRAGWDHMELPKPRRVSGCCQQLAPTPRGSTDQTNPGAARQGQSWPCHLPQVKCFPQFWRVLPPDSPAAGISNRRLGRVPGTPTVPSGAVPSCPIPGTAQSWWPWGQA